MRCAQTDGGELHVYQGSAALRSMLDWDALDADRRGTGRHEVHSFDAFMHTMV